MSQIIGPEFLVSGEVATKWSARVFVSQLYDGPWAWVPQLQVRSFSMCSAPEIAKATFTIDYGAVKQPQFPFIGVDGPLDLGNKFCRVELQNNYGNFIAWQGYLVDNNLDIWGESNLPGGAGIQTIQAYGLEYLLTKVKITEALARVQLGGPPVVAQWLDWVPPFNMNMNRGTSSAIPGNRSNDRYTVDLGGGNIQDVYVFNHTDREALGAEWSAADAVETVLKIYGTRLGIPWAVSGQLERIENWQPTHSIEGMTVWDALLSLMPKSRGISFTMEHTDPPTIWLSSTFLDDIVVNTDDGAVTFPGNPEVYDLDFNDALDVKNSVVFMSTQDRYREVIVTGEKARCTFTADVFSAANQGGVLQPGWSQLEEVQYKDPAIPPPPPGSDDNWLAQARDRSRSLDKYSRVYKYLYRRREWDGFINGVSTCPVMTDNGGVDFTQALLPAISGQGFMRVLPFLGAVDYSVDPPDKFTALGDFDQSDHRRPIGVIKDIASEFPPPPWLHLHELQRGAVPNIVMRMADTEYGIELPNAGHFLAEGSFNFDPVAEPGVTKFLPVFDYRDCLFTVQWQLDQRLKYKATISANPADAVLHLHVPGAHCWLVHPNTMVDVHEDGGLSFYAGDYEFRNDKDILKKVAAVATGWYSTRRNLCRYTIAGMFPHIPIGAMLGVGYSGSSFAQINTVVTKKLYRFDAEPTCTVMSGYSNLDIVQAAMTTLADRGTAGQSVGAGNRSAAQKGKIPVTPSSAVHIRQTAAARERTEREEDRTEQMPATIAGGMGGTGLGELPAHFHNEEMPLRVSAAISGSFNPKAVTMVVQEDGQSEPGPLGLYKDPVTGLYFSAKTKWA